MNELWYDVEGAKIR